MTSSDQFSVRVIGAQVWDPLFDNVDVEVTFADGRRYSATFFTMTNLERLFQKNQSTGECAGGTYLWAANMIIVKNLSMDAIKHTVNDLITKDEFESSFCALRNV